MNNNEPNEEPVNSSIESEIKRWRRWSRISRAGTLLFGLALLGTIVAAASDAVSFPNLWTIPVSAPLWLAALSWKRHSSMRSLLETTRSLLETTEDDFQEQRDQIERNLVKGEFDAAESQLNSLVDTFDNLQNLVPSRVAQSKLRDLEELRDEVRVPVQKMRVVSNDVDSLVEAIREAEASYNDDDFEGALHRLRTVEQRAENVDTAASNVKWSLSQDSRFSYPAVATYWSHRMKYRVTAGCKCLRHGDWLRGDSHEDSIEAYRRAAEHFERAISIFETHDVGTGAIDFDQCPTSRPTLTDVRGVGDQRSDLLEEHGFETPADLVCARSLTHIDGIGGQTERRLRRSAMELTEELLGELLAEAREKESDVHTLVARSEQIEKLDDANALLNQAVSDVESGDAADATRRLDRADALCETVAEELSDIETAESSGGDGESLRERAERLGASIDSVSVLAECERLIAEGESALEDDDATSALERFGETTRKLDELRETTDEIIPPLAAEVAERQRETVRESADAARELRTKAELETQLDRAEEQIESAVESLDAADEDPSVTDETPLFELAREELDTTRELLADVTERSEILSEGDRDRLRELESRAETAAERIDRRAAERKFEAAIDSAESQLDAGLVAGNDGEYSSAMGHFGQAKQHVNAAEELAGDTAIDSADERIDTVAERLEAAIVDTRQREAVAACREEMSKAETAIAEAIDRYEDESFVESSELYDEALTYLETANERAERSELPEQWEIERRLADVREYRSDARSAFESYQRRRTAEVAQHLDRAEQLVSKGRQQLGIEDGTAAHESCSTAEDAIQHAETIVREEEFVDEKTEQRVSEVADDVDALREAIRDAEFDLNVRSRRELVESLQELAVSFDESPRESFVRAYGPYPLEEYVETFGSWDAALDAANLEPVDHEARERRVYSRIDILDEIGTLAETLGREPSKSDMNDRGDMSAPTVEKRFGTWATALEMADIPEFDDSRPTGEVVAELTDVSGVTENDALELAKSGFESIEDLTTVSHEELVDTAGISDQLAMRIKADIGTMTSAKGD